MSDQPSIPVPLTPERRLTRVAAILARGIIRLRRSVEYYQYFTDMHELVESLLREVGAVMHQTADLWINGEGAPIAALRKSLRGVVQTCVDHGPVFVRFEFPIVHRQEDDGRSGPRSFVPIAKGVVLNDVIQVRGRHFELVRVKVLASK